MKIYNWNTIEDLSELQHEKLIFISGSRDITTKRIGQIFKENISRGPILWGCFDEEFIEGFEDQIQFKTLSFKKLKSTLDKIEKLILPNNFSILTYSQKDLETILQSISFYKVRFINGSWKIVFHRRPEFKLIDEKQISYKLISAFSDEDEARRYAEKIELSFSSEDLFDQEETYSDSKLLEIADKVAKRSFDYTWQTGCVVAKNGKIKVCGHNRVLPYETYAMFHGSLREKWKSELNDLNNYDTIHAEMDVLTTALNNNIDISDSTLYINLLPCPNCARVLSRTGIKEVVFANDHYGSYAKELFQNSGIKVRKLG